MKTYKESLVDELLKYLKLVPTNDNFKAYLKMTNKELVQQIEQQEDIAEGVINLGEF